MRSSSHSRQHWHARQLAAVEMGQQQPSMPLDDTHEACSTQPDTPALAWAPVWSRLHDLGLDRQQRLTAWRVLHGAFRAYIGRCRQLACVQRVRVSRRHSHTSSSPALRQREFGPGSQPSGRTSVAARDLHCPQRCSWQTISVTGSRNQHISSPCGLSCASPCSRLATLPARSAGRASPPQPPQLRQGWSTRCAQPCLRTGSVCAAATAWQPWQMASAAPLGSRAGSPSSPGAFHSTGVSQAPVPTCSGALYQTGAPQLTCCGRCNTPRPSQWGLGVTGGVRRLLAPLGGLVGVGVGGRVGGVGWLGGFRC